MVPISSFREGQRSGLGDGRHLVPECYRQLPQKDIQLVHQQICLHSLGSGRARDETAWAKGISHVSRRQGLV